MALRLPMVRNYTPSETYTYDWGRPRHGLFSMRCIPQPGIRRSGYQYDPYGRVSGMTEGRGSTSGDANYTTTFQYNARGPVSETHASGWQFIFNTLIIRMETLAWTGDEAAFRGLNRRESAGPATSTTTTNGFLSVTTPLRATGDSTARVTNYNYDPSGTGAGYSRTAALPTKVTSPGGQKSLIPSTMRTFGRQGVTAVGDANVASATTSYTYDGKW